MQAFDKKSFRVLIVDDTSDIHRDIRKILSWEPALETALQRMESALFETAEALNPASPTALPQLRMDSAFHGAQAVEMVQQAAHDQDPYQLILMDVRMPPGMDGVEATQKIWQIQPDVNVVICTAYSDYSIDAIISKLGISDKILFLTKPFSAAVLKQSAITMLRKWDLDQRLQGHTKNLENLVAQQTAMLAHSSGLAQEAGAPLDVIQLMIRELEATPIDPFEFEKARRRLQTIDGMAKRIAGIISILKSISRDREGAPFLPVPIKTILEDVLALCRVRFSNSRIELQVSAVPNFTIECRPGEISQVILNLLNNALAAVSGLPEKWVRLEIVEHPDSVQIKVTDSGRGPGLGQELSVSRRLAENHNGQIYLDPNSKHTSFAIRLPKIQPPQK